MTKRPLGYKSRLQNEEEQLQKKARQVAEREVYGAEFFRLEKKVRELDRKDREMDQELADWERRADIAIHSRSNSEVILRLRGEGAHLQDVAYHIREEFNLEATKYNQRVKEISKPEVQKAVEARTEELVKDKAALKELGREQGLAAEQLKQQLRMQSVIERGRTQGTRENTLQGSSSEKKEKELSQSREQDTGNELEI